jgi:hypothetical protein
MTAVGWTHYGGTVYRTRNGIRVKLMRGPHNRCQWVRVSGGKPLGPEQSNVAPAIAYAVSHHWVDVS